MNYKGYCRNHPRGKFSLHHKNININFYFYYCASGCIIWVDISLSTFIFRNPAPYSLAKRHLFSYLEMIRDAVVVRRYWNSAWSGRIIESMWENSKSGDGWSTKRYVRERFSKFSPSRGLKVSKFWSFFEIFSLNATIFFDSL